MTNHFVNLAIKRSLAVEEASDVDTEYTDINVDETSTVLHLQRVNTILDRLHKDRIFVEVLSSLKDKTACERAAQSFDSDYWVSLPLSWDSILELLAEVRLICKKYKTNIPDSWINLVDYDISPENQETQEYTVTRKAANV